MSPEKQREVIGELMGWKRHADGIGWYKGAHPRIHGGVMLPDYLNDLNACHEMEKVLTLTQCREFQAHLQRLEAKRIDHAPYAERFAFHATAAQRAEAFLKTLGLWEEDK